MPVAMRNSVASAIVLLLAASVVAFFVGIPEWKEPSARVPEPPRDAGSDTMQDSKTANQGITLDGIPNATVVESEQHDVFDIAIAEMFMLVDSADWAGARVKARQVLELVEADPSGYESKVFTLLEEVLDDPARGQRATAQRVCYLVLCLPFELRIAHFKTLLTEWAVPLQPPRHDTWSRTDGLADEIQAREALAHPGERYLCAALGYSIQMELLERDASVGSSQWESIVGMCHDGVSTHIVDPLLSGMLYELYISKRALPEPSYTALLKPLLPFTLDDRFSARLQLQIRVMLLDNAPGGSNAAAKLERVTSHAEASIIIASYLEADPQLLALDELLRILMTRMSRGDAHQALVGAFYSVGWLKTQHGVDSLAEALVQPHAGDSPDMMFIRVTALADLSMPLRLHTSDYATPTILHEDSVDIQDVFRRWIRALPDEGVYNKAEQSLLLAKMGGAILDSRASTHAKIALLSELVQATQSLDPFVKRVILAKLCWMPVNELIAARPEVLSLWVKIVNALYEKSAVPVLAQDQRREGIAILASSEYLLRLFGYPREMSAEQSLLDMYSDAASLDFSIDDKWRLRQERMHIQFASLVEAGYFK